MVAIMGYTLPAMQLVCHLVALGNITSTPVDQMQLQPQPRTLPEGYVAYPDVGFAYKIHHEPVVYIEGKRLCAEEGAQLAVIDTPKKVEYMRQHIPSNKYVHAGIIRVGSAYYNVNTGAPVTSIPWKTDEPSRDKDCLFLYGAYEGLGDWSCGDREYYACELPYFLNYMVARN